MSENVSKIASSSQGICLITKAKSLECYDNRLIARELPEELEAKVIELSMSDSSVCVAIVDSGVMCWDFFGSVKEMIGLHEGNNVKKLTIANKLVCTLNKQGRLKCTKSDVGAFQSVIPTGFESNSKNVITGVFATAAIDGNGDLRFWWNFPM